MRIDGLVLAQHIPAVGDEARRAVRDQTVAAAAEWRVDRTGNGENIASLLKRGIRRDERAALFRRFDHDGREAQAADDAVSHGKMPRLGRRPGRILADERARGRDIAVQPFILRGIDNVQPVAEHGDGLSARAQRAAVRCAVHARRRAGDHDRALLAQAVGDLLRRFDAVGRGLARADHGDSDLLVDNGELAFDIKQARRLKDIAQAHRIVRVLHREKPQPQPRTRAEDTVGVFQRFFREQCDLPRLDALDEAVLVLVGIVDVLRRAEIVEQQKL